MNPCLCPPADYGQCRDATCVNARQNAGEIVHTLTCDISTASGDECSCGAESPDNWTSCEHCHAGCWDHDLVNHGDITLCPKCSEEWIAECRACEHVFMEFEIDEWGDEGRCCGRCGVFIDQDFAMTWAPLICDGFVDVEEPSP